CHWHIDIPQQVLGTEAEGRLLVDRVYERSAVRVRLPVFLDRTTRRPHPCAFENDAVTLASRVDHTRLTQHLELGWGSRDGIGRGAHHLAQHVRQVRAGACRGLRRHTYFARNGQNGAFDRPTDAAVAHVACRGERRGQTGGRQLSRIGERFGEAAQQL